MSLVEAGDSTSQSEEGQVSSGLDLSVVIPLFNERENLRPLHAQLHETLNAMQITYEILYINDGSEDGSEKILEEFEAGDPLTTVLHMRRNFGQTAALAAGFDWARGAVVVTLDADLQNDPADIPRLLDLIKDYDIVSGWRKNRKDAFWNRLLPSRVANWLISRITGVRLRDYGCTLKAYRRNVVKNLELRGDLHRFVPAVASWMGIRVTEVEVNHRPRVHGESKYSATRIFPVLMDLLVVKFFLRFSASPIRFFGGVGMITVTAGLGISLYLTITKLVTGADIGGRPLLVMGILLIVVGFQLFLMGLLGELIARVYYGTLNKPIYVLRDSNAAGLSEGLLPSAAEGMVQTKEESQRSYVRE